MSGGGSSNSGPTQNTVQTNSLPAWLEPHLQHAAGQARSFYDSGFGGQPYPGSTYVPPTSDEMTGMGHIRDVSLKNLQAPNEIVRNTLPTWNNIVGNAGLLSGHRNALNPAFDIATGQNRITIGDFESGNDPNFNKALQNASDRTMDTVNSRMASMGRLGSGAHTGVASREIGDLQTAARAQQLNHDRQLQLQAQGANIANQGQTSLALGDQFGSARDASLRGMALAPMMDDLRFAPARRLMELGGGLRGELQTELQTNIDRFRDEQMAPWANLGLLSGSLQGFPDMSTRSTTQTSTVPKGSALSGAFGGAATGAGIGSSFGPWGAGVGGLLGGLGGLFL